MEELANGLMHKTTTSALVELRHPTETELTWIGNIFPYKQINIHRVITNQAAVKPITMQDYFKTTDAQGWDYKYWDELI